MTFCNPKSHSTDKEISQHTPLNTYIKIVLFCSQYQICYTSIENPCRILKDPGKILSQNPGIKVVNSKVHLELQRMDEPPKYWLKSG